MSFLFINFLPALLEVAIATVGMTTITYLIELVIQSRDIKDKSEVIIKVDGEKFSSIFIDDNEYSASRMQNYSRFCLFRFLQNSIKAHQNF